MNAYTLREALLRGDAAFAAYGADTVCVLRYAAGETCLLAVNRGAEAVTLRPAALDFLGASAAARDALERLPEVRVPAMDSAWIQLEKENEHD